MLVLLLAGNLKVQMYRVPFNGMQSMGLKDIRRNKYSTDA
jgi:hypothetical protein